MYTARAATYKSIKRMSNDRVMLHIQKETLREQALKHRERIDISGHDEDPDKAARIFMDVIRPQQDQIIALYWPKGREFDPSPIMALLAAKNIQTALPVVIAGQKELGFVCWQEGAPLEEGAFGILQPPVSEKTAWVDPDILIVPLLAFDRKGARLGYGGGYYDATLRYLRTKKDIVAVGVGYARQAVLFNLPQEPHDERLDWVITPQEAHRCKA